MSFRLPLPFGEGLDRFTGIGLVSPQSFYDLRNVDLLDGRMQGRGGLLQKQLFTGDETVLMIHPIRAQGIGVICTYDEGTRNVKVYLVPPDLSFASLIGTLFTIPATAGYPRIVAADSFGLLFMAHDEPSYADRQPTKVFDPALGTLSAINVDLGGGLEDVKFRGVARHLAYLVGWGYGNKTTGNKPEIVRYSLPGDPAVFKSEHWFTAGQASDPVTAGASTGDQFLAFKESETFEIFGYDRTTFGIRPSDPLYGCLGGRLAISVGGVCYYWSLEGPRRSSGGPSDDLSLPLYINGPSPSALAPQSFGEGFAVYHPVKRIISWTFDQWSYCLHIADPRRPRWTFRQYARRLYAGGMLYQGSGASTLGPQAYPQITACVLTGVNDRQIKVDWNNVGAIDAAQDKAEVWSRPASTGVWAKVADNIALAGATGTATCDVQLYADNHEIAVRFKRTGVYNAAYITSNASLWPAVSRFASILTQLTITPVLNFLMWERLSASSERVVFTHLAPAVQGNLMLSLEKRIGGGAWVPADAGFQTTVPNVNYTPGAGEPESYVDIRAFYHNSLRTGPSGAHVQVWVGPSPYPSGTTVTAETDGYYYIGWTPAPGATTGWLTEISTRRDANPFTVDNVVPFNSGPYLAQIPCPATTVDAKLRHKTQFFGVDDFSDYAPQAGTAADCDGLP